MLVKYQVFVSSTFEDLQDERRQVTEAVLNLGHIPVGMEAFQASNESQWHYIKRRIAECDYYVVIVGERYGSEFKGKSYTQMEYEFAMSQGLPVAAFLMSATARANLPQTRVQFDKADKVKAFRDLCQQKLCKHWDNGTDLAGKVILALSELTRDFPMRGWVRPAKVPPEDILEEMARLLEENRELRAKVEDLQLNADAGAPADILLRIQQLNSIPLKSTANEDPSSCSLLDAFLALAKSFGKGCETGDVIEILDEACDAAFDTEDDADDVVAEFTTRNLVNVERHAKQRLFYLTEYGADFIMYAEQWLKENQPPEPGN